MLTYLDTSALAKWYLNESRSEDFSIWAREQSDTHISRLTALELRCLLARRRRARDFSATLEQRIYAAFEQDIRDGHLIMHPLGDRPVAAAIMLLERVAPIALRTLDAVHLRVALDMGAEQVATADRTMAEAADEVGLRVKSFWS